MTSFALAGTGVYRPAAGCHGRPVANVDETSSMMAATAARGALDAAGWQAGDCDVLIGACSVMEQPIPGTAVLVQRRLGLGGSGRAAFDVNATCLSALVAIDIVAMGFATGRWRRALIVSADQPSAAVDPKDPDLAPIFGDGAAALALEAGGAHQVLASHFESHGDYADLCALDAGGTRVRADGDFDTFMAATRFRMSGPALYRATARLFPAFLDRLMTRAGISRDAIDLIVPHQASAPAIDHLAHVLGGARGRIVDIFAEHGNQVASSLPCALHVARTTGRLHAGETALLVGSAAGITLGGMVVRW